MGRFNIEKQHHFVLLPDLVGKVETTGQNAGKMRENFGSHSFRGYTDKDGVFGKKGVEVEYVTSRNAQGRDRGKYFTINQSHNCLMVNEGNTDINGKSEYQFILNSPFCEGSPNGAYTVSPEGDRIQIGVIFRLMNSEADAEVALEANIRSSKAVISASEVDEETLSEVAALGVGLHGAPDKIMRHRVTEWARKRPVDYFEILNSGDRALRAIVRKALADGLFVMRGSLIYWEQTLIGSDEDGAVGALNKDAQMLDVLKEKLDFKRLDVKKPAGRPVGTTKKNV